MLRWCWRRTWERTRSSSRISRRTGRPATMARNSVGVPGTRPRAAAPSSVRMRVEPLVRATAGGSNRSVCTTSSDVTEGAQDDAVLAERGEHALDVGGVGPGRADDEDAAGLEAAPVGVEQVGRAVEGDDGLARAGATRDLGDATCAGADGLVLVGLDRRDDVAHALAAAAGQGRHERAVPDDDEVVRGLGDHEVVLDADDDRAAAAQDTTAQDAHRLRRGRTVEGGRGRRAPVDDERLVVVVTDAEAPDVADLAVATGAAVRRAVVAVAVGVDRRRPEHRVVDVEAPEHEPFVLRVEGRAPLGGVEHQGVPLEEGSALGVADLDLASEVAACQALGLDAVGAHAGLLQLLVDAVDVGLLDRDLAGELVGDALGRHRRGAPRSGRAGPLGRCVRSAH